MRLSSEFPARARSTHNSFFAPNVFQFILVSLLCYAISDEVHAENSWPLKQYKNATVVLKSSEENGSGEIMFETELLTVFNALKLNASISGDDEDTFDVLSELESAMDDLLSLAPEMLETELEFDVYATNKTSCQRECAKGNHCCNYDESRGSNQKLSCLQACLVRISGVSKSECDASCSSDGCTKFGYSLCSDCTDVISSNACSSNWGSSTDTCLAGCSIGRAVHYLTDATIQSAITNCLSESPVDGLCATYGLITTKFGTLPNWDVSRVSDLKEAFKGYDTFNADISKWDTSQVTNMREIFRSASAFNQNIGIWNTEKVTDMVRIFYKASAFDQDIGSWNTAQVTTMFGMFYSASSFNRDIFGWTGTAATTPQTNMFLDATAFQAKYECTDAVTGPASSCNAIKSTWVAPPPPPSPPPSPQGPPGTFNGINVYQDGDGWFLLLAYNHFPGEDKAIVPGTAPQSPTESYSHVWLNDLGLTANDVEAVRFYCKTSEHDRIVHFSTELAYTKQTIVYGTLESNSASYWNTGTTKFADHTGQSPDSVNDCWGMGGGQPPASCGSPSRATCTTYFSYPFYKWGSPHNLWHIGSGNYLCDDDNHLYTGISETTTHQIWFKKKQ